MEITLSAKKIEQCTCGAQLIKWFARAMSEPRQLWRIFSMVSNGTSFIEAIVHNPINFGLYAAHISWFGMDISYAVLEPYTLHLICAIIKLHRLRRTLFTENITNVYTIKYEKCSYDTLLQQHVRYDLCALTCAAFYTAERRSMMLNFLQWKNENASINKDHVVQSRIQQIASASGIAYASPN